MDIDIGGSEPYLPVGEEDEDVLTDTVFCYCSWDDLPHYAERCSLSFNNYDFKNIITCLFNICSDDTRREE